MRNDLGILAWESRTDLVVSVAGMGELSTSM